MPDDTLDRFSHPTYELRRKFFKLFGAGFHIYDPTGDVAFYSKLKAFKLREDIRVFAGEDMQREVLHITTKSIFDFSGAYDVVDPISNERVGALKRRGLKSSFLRDHWDIVDEHGQEIGSIQEDSQFKAIARRVVDYATIILPQGFTAEIGGQPVATFKQHFNPIIQKITLDYSMDTQALLDRRLGIAAAILLCAIEGRQG